MNKYRLNECYIHMLCIHVLNDSVISNQGLACSEDVEVTGFFMLLKL